jgi:hypothetical protein
MPGITSVMVPINAIGVLAKHASACSLPKTITGYPIKIQMILQNENNIKKRVFI